MVLEDLLLTHITGAKYLLCENMDTSLAFGSLAWKELNTGRIRSNNGDVRTAHCKCLLVFGKYRWTIENTATSEYYS